MRERYHFSDSVTAEFQVFEGQGNVTDEKDVGHAVHRQLQLWKQEQGLLGFSEPRASTNAKLSRVHWSYPSTA